MAVPFQGLLLRFPADSTKAQSLVGRSISLAESAFQLEPLFDVPSTANGTNGMGLAGTGRQWMVARGPSLPESDNPWELVHDSLSSLGFGAEGGPDLVEPDLQQQWLHGPVESQGLGVGDTCAFEDQVRDLPGRPGEFAWHLGDGFSQLKRAGVDADHASKIRIVHLDTGYDDSHKTYPRASIEKDLQRNFVDADRPGDARDRGIDGMLKNPGHGAGTLSILAGGKFKFEANGYRFNDILGGAAKAKIVPVRVGNSVVQLTTSAVAQGINYAAELCNDPATRVDVISMSMGGVASAAWADAVNKAYLAGVVYVAAAGNNFSARLFGFPTRHVVYPARFGRVIAACGVMADRKPYFGLSIGTMQGNWGPPKAMRTALAAFTPNMPWAKWGCDEIVLMTGAGTSSATPQIASAAALYLHAHAATLFDPQRYPHPWMRVEAVRQALFESAEPPQNPEDGEKLGHGILRAANVLKRFPPDSSTLRMTPADRAGFPFLNVLSRRGLAPSVQDRMLQLEATQLVQRWEANAPNPLETAISDPDLEAGQTNGQEVVRFLEAIREHPRASQVLKRRCALLLDGMSNSSAKKPALPQRSKKDRKLPAEPEVRKEEEWPPVETDRKSAHVKFHAPQPPYRKLRGYALDPSLSTRLATVGISKVTFKVPWEKLAPGPAGEYLEVVDIDPPSRLFYEPVDLDDPLLLAQDGLAPSDGVPQFHQQMVYAVASLTINNFERALGRQSLWRAGPALPGKHSKVDSHYVPRLRIYPHALREPNAFYSPGKIALLFGYFNTSPQAEGQLPGGRVFTCLSHDIIAHETVHALLDGMHRTFLVPTNRDVHAFHEAFADCVAMLQHFTFPELLAHQIANTRGEIDVRENLLVSLAAEFGHATGKRMALRDAIGSVDQDGKWKYEPPDPNRYETVDEPHERGQILVRAVFEAFLSIYRKRSADLIRLTTGGSGVLRPGALHPDLVARLADEAAKSAQHVLQMCIRALDYCPPTDITFGEYLRAIITADYDLIPDDKYDYRISFIDSFRNNGIFPPGVRTLSVGSLLWRRTDEEHQQPTELLRKNLAKFRGAAENLSYAEDRREVFELQRELRRAIHSELKVHFQHKEGSLDAAYFGIKPKKSFEVHTARVAVRTHPDGRSFPQLLVGILQRTRIPVDPADPKGLKMTFEGGCTVVVDLRALKIRYCIRKRISSRDRRLKQQQFALADLDSLQATYLGIRNLDAGWEQSDSALREPFALIHRTL